MGEARKVGRQGWTALAILVLLGAAAAWWRGHAVPTVPLPGGDGGGLPRAAAESEGFDAVAMTSALELARSEGMQAFIVSRHGHVVLAEYANGLGAQSRSRATGDFATALVALAAGVAREEGLLDEHAVAAFDPARIASAIATASKQSYPQFLSRAVWKPVNAANAVIDLPATGAPVPADCCVLARTGDWMRIAELLLQGGRFEGTQVVSAQWVQKMIEPRDARRTQGSGVWLASSARGAEPFASDGVFYLKGEGRSRLWMAPALQTAVLFVAAGDESSGWDETRLPNRVFRALGVVPSTSTHDSLNDLVPGH